MSLHFQHMIVLSERQLGSHLIVEVAFRRLDWKPFPLTIISWVALAIT